MRGAVKYLLSAIALLNLAVMQSCDSSDTEPDGYRQSKELKVLCIGNSFTEDAFSYVPALFSNAAPDVKLTIGIAYIGGSPLVQHYVNITGAPATVSGSRYVRTGYFYHKSSDGENVWYDRKNVNIETLLMDEKWDIVTFQQSGGQSARDYDLYFSPYIGEIERYVVAKCGDDVDLGWVLTHGCYFKDAERLRQVWEKTADNSARVIEQTGFSLLFPYGTALQNLREMKSVANESDAAGWTVDTGHLQEGLGCLVAAYANTIVLLDYLGITPTEETFGFIPTQSALEFMNIPNPSYGQNGIVGLSPYNCRMAFRAAQAAVENPYVITDIE